MKSELLTGATVSFPAFTGERVYMREFTPGRDLPADLERWQPTVDAMLRGVRATGKAYLMIDQAEVPAARTHRRPGLHVDGYWHPGVGHNDGPAPGGGHNPAPAPRPGHIFAGGHGGHCQIGAREALVIAASVEGCEAFEGEWAGEAGKGGDCSAVDVRSLTRRRMPAGVAFVGETGAFLHAAIQLVAAARRTVVRVNVQGWL